MLFRIGYMSGSGGDFLSRCLSIHNEIACYKDIGNTYEDKFKNLSYEELDKNQAVKRNNTWTTVVEKTLKKIPENEYNTYPIKTPIIQADHYVTFCNLRITTKKRAEWLWSLRQTLWKNSRFSQHLLMAGLKDDHDIDLPCSDLWDFKKLSLQLTKIEEYLKIEKNNNECRAWQKKLWDNWITTWAPPEIDKLLDKCWQGPQE